MAYYASNPMPVMQASFTAVLRGEMGLHPSMPRDPRCVFAWAPFSKLKDRGALLRSSKNTMQCSSYYARSGLVHKDKLHAMLQGAGSQLALPTVPIAVPATPQEDDCKLARPSTASTQSFDHDPRIRDSVDSAWLELSAAVEALGCADNSATAAQSPSAAPVALECAVLKHSRTNNAFDVHIVTSPAETHRVLLQALARQASGEAPAPVSGTWCLQQHCPRMLLVDGCKWTVRANMLCVGRLAVFLHEHVVCHVASVPLQPISPAEGASPLPPPEQHITNHSVQHALPTYRRHLHTLLLSDLLEQASSGSRAFSCFNETIEPQSPLAQSGHPAGTTSDVEMPFVPSLPRAMATLADALADTVQAVFQPGTARWFMPTRNNFEVFGVDLMPCVTQCGDLAWRVLEVNEGPALEALAMPPLNRDIVRDTVGCVTAAWINDLQHVEHTCGEGEHLNSAEHAPLSPRPAVEVTTGGEADPTACTLQRVKWSEQHSGGHGTGAASEPASGELPSKGAEGGWRLVAHLCQAAVPHTGNLTAILQDTAVTQSFKQHISRIRGQLAADSKEH